MLERSVESKGRYVASLVIGTIIFLLIILLSFAVAYFQHSRVVSLQGETAYALFEEKLRYTFFGEDLCLKSNFKKLTEHLGVQGRFLDDLEKKLGKDDSRVLEGKKLYTVLLLEHLQHVDRYNTECDEPVNTILFFYSNSGDNADSSEKMGRILDSVYSLNSNTAIYSFDVNLKSNVIELLKKKYAIEKAPTIIINGNKTLRWPLSSDEILQEMSY